MLAPAGGARCSQRWVCALGGVQGLLVLASLAEGESVRPEGDQPPRLGDHARSAGPHVAAHRSVRLVESPKALDERGGVLSGERRFGETE